MAQAQRTAARRANAGSATLSAYVVAEHRPGSWSAFEKWSGHVVPKCCHKGGGYDFKKERMLKKIRGRKSGQAMAGPPTTALQTCSDLS